MYSHKCPILEGTLSNHLPITPCLPGDSSGSCPGYWFTQRPWLGFQPRVRGTPMRRPPIVPNSLWSSCQATGFYVVHVVGWGACHTNATKKAHAYVHVDRDRHTHMHLFLSHLLKCFAPVCRMERILHAGISPLGFSYNESFCLSPLEPSSLLLLWLNSVCLEVHIANP